MLQSLPAQIPGLAWSLAITIPCIIVVFGVIERLVVNHRLSKVNGVRASILGGNPVTSFYHFFNAGYMHANNRLLENFIGMFKNADPSCPHAVEMTIFGHRSILTIDPEHIKALLTTNFTHFGKGKKFHRTWKPFLGDSIFTTDGQLWQQSRNLIRPMFIKQKIRDLDILERWNDVLISKLPPSGQTVDICDLFYRMTLDAITDYLLGQSVESLDNPNGEFTKTFTLVQRTQMLLAILAPFQSFIPQAEYKKGIKTLEAFIQPFIDATLALTPEELDRISKSDKEFTFLHNLALFSRDPKVIRDQIMAVLLAGRDTTAATLSWTLYELSNYPEIWSKLRNRVLETVGPEAAPTYEDLKDLTCLTHALNETLRLYPAVPFNVRSCRQPDIATLKGDHILYSTIVMQRRKDLYPPVSDAFADPAIYSPERWEHWTPKPWQFVPFNGGPRICIGQNFAMTEMAFTLVRLLQRYERIEYRGDWAAQYLKADIVGCPGQGVPIALYEAKKRGLAPTHCSTTMRERITYFRPQDADMDPKQLEIHDTKVQGPAIKALREHKITLTLAELPSELAGLLRDVEDLHLRWATSASYDTLEPFSSRVSPGLHVSYTPVKEDHDPEKLCTALQAFGRLDCSSPEVFINNSDGRQEGSSALFFYNELEKLDGFAKRLGPVVCSGPTAAECKKQLQGLKDAVSLDMSYDSTSESVKIQALWPLQKREISVPASPKGRTEVGILGRDAPPGMKEHEIGVSGVLTVIGESKEPSPALFAFAARHRAATGSFTSKFQQPTGLHPTLELSLSTTAPPLDEDAQCAPYAYFTLPKVIFADRYQLADELFLASKNLAAAKYVSEPVDLEAPAYTTKTWGSNVLLELAPPKDKAAAKDWTVEVPLHLRYLKPSPTGKEEAGIPYPVVFWACDGEKDTAYAVSPFDRVNLGYDGLFGPETTFWHVSPKPEADGRLINNISVPVVTEGASQWVGIGTAVAVGLGFIWVLLKLMGGYAKSGHGTAAKPAEDEGKKEK
ncbi:cytochrome P450 [Trichoderma barbatum]